MKELFNGTPKEFRKVYDHIKGLSFEERPNYKYFKLQLDLIMAKSKEDSMGALDWLKGCLKKR